MVDGCVQQGELLGQWLCTAVVRTCVFIERVTPLTMNGCFVQKKQLGAQWLRRSASQDYFTSIFFLTIVGCGRWELKSPKMDFSKSAHAACNVLKYVRTRT